MTKDAQSILRDAMALGHSDRTEIATRLLESLELPSDIDYETVWKRELRRRIQRLDSGEAKLVPWSDLRDHIWQRLSVES